MSENSDQSVKIIHKDREEDYDELIRKVSTELKIDKFE